MASTESGSGGSHMSSDHLSILYVDAHDAPGDDPAHEPEHFADLRLDQIIASLTRGRDEYRLTPFLHHPLRSVETVSYRHQVMGDLERGPVRTAADAFVAGMGRVRTHLRLAEHLRHPLQQQRW